MLQYIYMNRSGTIYTNMVIVIVSSHSICLPDFSMISVYYFDRTIFKDKTFRRIKIFPNSFSASLELWFYECFYIYKLVETNTPYLPFTFFLKAKT